MVRPMADEARVVGEWARCRRCGRVANDGGTHHRGPNVENLDGSWCEGQYHYPADHEWCPACRAPGAPEVDHVAWCPRALLTGTPGAAYEYLRATGVDNGTRVPFSDEPGDDGRLEVGDVVRWHTRLGWVESADGELAVCSDGTETKFALSRTVVPADGVLFRRPPKPTFREREEAAEERLSLPCTGRQLNEHLRRRLADLARKRERVAGDWFAAEERGRR